MLGGGGEPVLSSVDEVNKPLPIFGSASGRRWLWASRVSGLLVNNGVTPLLNFGSASGRRWLWASRVSGPLVSTGVKPLPNFGSASGRRWLWASRVSELLGSNGGNPLPNFGSASGRGWLWASRVSGRDAAVRWCGDSLMRLVGGVVVVWCLCDGCGVVRPRLSGGL